MMMKYSPVRRKRLLNQQFNVIPMKDYHFDDSYPMSAKNSHTRSTSGLRGDPNPAYLKKMKYKADQKKKLYDDEFVDLKVKKEV